MTNPHNRFVQAYLYRMGKGNSCGDDFDYKNAMWARYYASPKTKSIYADYFQPEAGVWYTVWSHIKMNTAGATLMKHGNACRNLLMRQMSGRAGLL